VARISPPVSAPWTARLLNFFLTRRFGKPFPAVKLLGHHPRYPFAYGVLSSTFGLAKTKLPQDVKRLATQLVAELNGCAFCVDLGLRFAQDEKLNVEKLKYVLDFENRPLYKPSERVALRYAFEATQVGARVSDETFAELKKHFSEREILELTVAVATENFYNRLNAPLEVESQGFCAVPIGQAQRTV
jgi:AhpD family alkylhydroperoxidase